MQENPQPAESKIVYQNSWFKIREDMVANADGTKALWPVIETNDAVAIIATNEKNEICFIQAYRHATQSRLWRLPGGMGTTSNEPIQAAMHYLAEETGFVSSEYHLIGSLQPYSLVSKKVQVVLMRSLQQTGENRQTQMGIETMRFQPLEDVEKTILNGEIDDAGTIAAIYIYKSWLSRQHVV